MGKWYLNNLNLFPFAQNGTDLFFKKRVKKGSFFRFGKPIKI
jgi:hypothetical protein